MSIEKSTKKNIGSIISLQYVLVSEIQYFPIIVKYESINFYDIVLNDAEWKNIYFTPETCESDSQSKTDDPGTIYNNSINFEYPAENEDASGSLENIKGLPILVIAKNLNGVEKLFGTPENPVKLQYNQPTGGAVMESTGYEITISGDGIFPALFVKRS